MINNDSRVVTKVVHIISGLSRGGAEKMLAKLVSVLDPAESLNVVVSLTDVNVVGQQLQSAGFRVHSLNMKRGRLSLVSVAKLSRFLKLEKPDVVQTWLYHGDLVGGVAARLAGQRRVIWNIRHGSLDKRGSKLGTIWVMKACSFLSSVIPKKMVFCSNRSRDIHVAAGYCSRKVVLIPNGLDLSIWKPDPEARLRLRAALGLSEGAVVVGHPARFDPQKDHATFIQAAALAHARVPSLRFMLCGENIHKDNEALNHLLQAFGKAEIFSLLGPRDDMHELMNAFDFVCSSSAFGEAFPNVLLEAMACKVPCVTTDVGDACHVIGETGLSVPPRNVPQLTDALVKMARIGPLQRQNLGEQARDRAVKNFDILQISNRYATLYRELVKDPPQA